MDPVEVGQYDESLYGFGLVDHFDEMIRRLLVGWARLTGRELLCTQPELLRSQRISIHLLFVVDTFNSTLVMCVEQRHFL
jgi:hypothetical protein